MSVKQEKTFLEPEDYVLSEYSYDYILPSPALTTKPVIRSAAHMG